MSFSPDADFPVINTEKGGFRPKILADFAPTSALPRLLSFQSGFKINVVPDTATATVAGMTADEAQPFCEKAAVQTGVTFHLEDTALGLQIAAAGVGAHAAHPQGGNNALTALLSLVAALPLAECDSTRSVRALAALFPHGDFFGQAAGIAQADAVSGPLTASFNMLTLSEASLEAAVDCRTPLCATEENTRQVFARRCAEAHLILEGDMRPPHHVPADSPLVKTLLEVYERYTGEKAQAISTGGGTYVHDLENGVAFGCTFPGVDNHIHGADERVSLDDLLLSGAMFAQAIWELCGA